jgi:hypothetical protein
MLRFIWTLKIFLDAKLSMLFHLKTECPKYPVLPYSNRWIKLNKVTFKSNFVCYFILFKISEKGKITEDSFIFINLTFN